MENNRGIELKLLRIKSGVKARNVATMLNKSSAWVSKMEKGEIAISEELYNRLKSLYDAEIEILQKDKMYDEKISFLTKENQKLKELLSYYIKENEEINRLLLFYMPHNDKDIEKTLRRVNADENDS